ncbi:MAG: class I SAM-dependent methyltransferase [Actinomycetota bacterium]
MSEWRQSIERFVRTHLPSAPARVLEFGCGDGELALALDRAGYDVVAIDPEAPDGPIFVRTTLEEFDEGRSFDAVVGIVVLHHIHDLDAGLHKIGTLVKGPAPVVLAEFAWEHLDAATLQWCAERLPSETAGSWLAGMIERARTAASEPGALSADAVRRWAGEEGIHSYEEMRPALDRHLSPRHFDWAAYLFDDLANTSERDELQAISAGDIRPVGFRYVGAKKG